MESYLTDPRHDETQSPEERDASEPKFEAGPATVEGYKFLYPADGDVTVVPTPTEFEATPPFIMPVEAQTGPWALNVSSSGEAAVRSLKARAVELEEFYAEGTTPLADTSVKVDGDRTQLTETQMGAVVEEVLDQTITGDPQGFKYGPPSLTDQEIVNSKLEYYNRRIAKLETFNQKLLVALKAHGFDTVKLFR